MPSATRLRLRPASTCADPAILTDGYLAAGDSYDDPGWIAWPGGGGAKQITLEPKKPVAVRNVRGHFDAAFFGLVPPKSVEAAVSDDGKTFRTIGAAARFRRPQASRLVFDQAGQPGDGAVRAADRRARRRMDLHRRGNGQRRASRANFPHAAVGRPVTLATTPANPVIGTASLTDGNIGHTPQIPVPRLPGLRFRAH